MKNTQSKQLFNSSGQNTRCLMSISSKHIFVTPSPVGTIIDENYNLKSILVSTVYLNSPVNSQTIVRVTNKSIVNMGLNKEKITAFVSDN